MSKIDNKKKIHGRGGRDLYIELYEYSSLDDKDNGPGADEMGEGKTIVIFTDNSEFTIYEEDGKLTISKNSLTTRHNTIQVYTVDLSLIQIY